MIIVGQNNLPRNNATLCCQPFGTVGVGRRGKQHGVKGCSHFKMGPTPYSQQEKDRYLKKPTSTQVGIIPSARTAGVLNHTTYHLDLPAGHL